MGKYTNELVCFMEKLEVPVRHIILSDLANSRHGYTASEAIQAYRIAQEISEDHEKTDFTTELFKFINESYVSLKRHLGIDAMQPVVAEAEDLDDKSDEEKSKDASEKHKQDASKKTDPIKKAVRSKGEDQTDMADKMGVHKSTISRWSSGSRKPSFDNLQDIKKKYGMGTVNQLLGA